MILKIALLINAANIIIRLFTQVIFEHFIGGFAINDCSLFQLTVTTKISSLLNLYNASFIKEGCNYNWWIKRYW